MRGAASEAVVDLLPWPNVRGKRCLALGGPGAPDLATVLEARGAASVDTAADGVYDVVVAWGVLAGAPDAPAVAATVRRATRGVALSSEPMELWPSLWSRGRPLFVPHGGGGFRFNGAGHRYLLEDAGFSIERVGRPFTVPDGSARRAPEALVARALTGGGGDGTLHRALLARPVVA